MVYGLNAKQKKALTQAVDRYRRETGYYPIEATDLEEFEDIERINPCEIFWQAANRFVYDLVIKMEFEKGE